MSNRSKRRTCFILTLLCTVLLVPGSIRAKAADSTEKNYLTDEEYKKFGMQLNDPGQFTDQENDPLMNYKPNYISELFISSRNSDEHDGSEINDGYFFQQNVMKQRELSDILKKSQTINSGSNIESEGKEWQMNNSVAANIDGNELGKQVIIQMAGMYDKELKKGVVGLYQTNGNNQWEISYSDMLSTGSESYVSDYKLDETAGYTAMAAGDYDGDGKDEVAFYVAATKDPYIRIVNIEINGSKSTCTTLDKIYLKQITSDKRFEYDSQKEKSRYMPVVNLATTTMSGKADLVVNVSLPMLDQGFIKEKVQTSVAAFYSHQSSGMQQVNKLELQYPDTRIRFASAVEGNIMGDGKKELIIGGYINQGYNSGDILGKLNTDENAIQIILWSKEKGYYPYFAEPKRVPAVTGKGLQVNDKSKMPALEPACLSAANLTGGSKDYIFLEGKILNYNEKEGKFVEKGTLDFHGDGKSFIKTAVAGNFVAGTPAKQQIYVISGDRNSSKYDQIYLDISVIYTNESDDILVDLFRNNFYDKQNEADTSTWLTFCAVNVDDDTVYTKYKGKTAGWSRPELYTVLQSPPYWRELDYSNQIYGAGSATYTIEYGRSQGGGGSLGLGLGLSLSLRASAGTGLFGTHVTVGGGIDVEGMAELMSSWSTTNGVEDSIGVTVPPGDDYAILFAVPVVTYIYDIFIPTYTVTQDHINYYKENQQSGESSYDYKVGDVVKGHTEEIKVSSEFEPSFSSVSVAKYNEQIKGIEGMKKITDESMPHKENGDPSSYPKVEQELKDLKDAKNVRLSKDAATTTGNVAARTLTVTYEKSSEESIGFNLSVDAAIVGTAEVSYDFIVTAKGSLEVGAKGHLEGGLSFVESSSAGNQFQVIFADYPSDAGEAYSFSTKLGIYNAGQLVPEKGKGDGPYVLSYVVTQEGESKAPPMLPVNLKVYNTTAHEIVLNWENSDYRKAGSYELFRMNTLGSFVSLGRVDGDETFYVDSGLDADTVYQYKMVAYQEPGQQGIRRAMSKPVQGMTKSLLENGPHITKQPDSTGANVGDAEGPYFTVEAVPGNPNNSLMYQWQKYEVGMDSNIGTFTNIAGANEAVYQLPPVTEDNQAELSGTIYCVQVTESNGKAVSSRAVTLYVNDEHLSYFQTQTDLQAVRADGSNLLKIGNEYYVKEGDILKFTVAVTGLGEGSGVPTGDVVLGVANEAGNLQELGPVSLDENGYCEIEAPLDKGTYRVEAWYLGNLEDAQTTSKYFVSNSEILKLSFGQYDKEEKYYFIEYIMDGGQENNQNPRIYTKDSGIITLAAPADKPGAVFSGWYLDETKTNKIETIDTSLEEMHKNLVIYAGWQEIVYPITYELNGGINAPENPASYTVSTPNIKLKAPALAGQQFEGWYMEPECTTAISWITKGSTGEKTLYAKWAAVVPPEPSPDEDTKYYQIRSMDDLYDMASKVNSGAPEYVDASYRLMNNIDGNGAAWNTPIGTAENPFIGVLEGDNYTIHNVNMSGTEQALFHTIGKTGEVKNLRVYTFIGDGNAVNAAGFAVYNKGTINHCHSGMNVDSSVYVDENGQVDLEAFNSKLTASETAGGIAAWNEGSITNSVSSAIVNGRIAGGIAGINTGTIENGYNTGRITGSHIAGGIVGRNQAEGGLFNLYSCGNVSGAYAGSIAGTSDTKKIEKCYFNSSENAACSNQKQVDAVYMRAPEMKSTAFADTLNENIKDRYELTSWYQENERNAGYPRIYNQGMSKVVLQAGEFGITVSGYGIHRNARLSVQKLNSDSAIYKQFQAYAPEAEIQNVFDITLVDENGSKLDYDSPLLLYLPIECREKLAQIQILHRLDEKTIHTLEKPADFDNTGIVFTKSLSAFAVIRSQNITTDQGSGETPKPAENPEHKQAIAADTGDSATFAVVLLVMLLAAVIVISILRKGRGKK